jgi:predicted Zn-dependent peptidase
MNLIFPEEIQLNNGVVLYWMKDVKDDSVKLDIEWNAGTKYQDKKLVAGFSNKMLLSGSNDLLAKDIAEEIDFYGGYSQLELDKDQAGVILYGLRDNISIIFSVFAKAFEHVAYPQDEFEKEVSISLDKFKVDSKKVKVLCRRAFGVNLYGANTKYGQVAVQEDFKLLKREDLIAFHKKHYSYAPKLFLTGNVTNEFIEMLRDWSCQFKGQAESYQPQSFQQTKGRVDVPQEDAIQSAIRIGRLMFDKNHPDYFSYQLLNTILGGYFGSRLMANIREDKGYTYGIGSGLSVTEECGYFFVTAEVGADVKEKAIVEVYNEFDRLKNEAITEDELTRVKNYMLGEFLRQADGPIALMDIFKNIHYNKLKKTYYSDFIQAIHSTTAEDLMALAKKYLNKEEMLEVTSG